jgi:arylsulfatase A-like enzyme
MNKKISRREFVKLSSLAFIATKMASLFAKSNFSPAANGLPNFVILVFDAFSASNTSLFGYPRKTTPNLERLANQAIIYHRYHAGGHWTVPGTYTLLTGVNTWTHRGFDSSVNMLPEYKLNNIFSLLDNHYRVAYTHNPLADKIIRQMHRNIENHQDLQSLFIEKSQLLSRIFANDYDIYSLSKVRALKQIEDNTSYSLFLSNLYQQMREILPDFAQYPYKPPYIEEDNYFHLADAIDWIRRQIEELPKPFLGYFHLLPPHRPYAPLLTYFDQFKNDGQTFTIKPPHFMSNQTPQKGLDKQRKKYDEFVLNVDGEIGRLMDSLEESGALKNTWIILTSDHGQMFERGIHGHNAHVFFEPVIRVPLIIFSPEYDHRMDIHTPVSAVDIIPTLLKLSNQPIPSHLEGEVLPPFGEDESTPQRPIFAFEGKNNKQDKPLSHGTVMLVRDEYKMTYYFGYDGLPDNKPYCELYHLPSDPEEMDDLTTKQPDTAAAMLDEIISKIEEENSPYR